MKTLRPPVPPAIDSSRPFHLLLGVTGGIAAYKCLELVRRLRERGHEVQVVMTRAATRFVGPLGFQAVSGHPVRTDLWDTAAEAGMGHIELARWADLILVAPASAHSLARLAHGLADDLLGTLCLASRAPVAVAPAMNQAMWAHPATRANVALLEARGVRIWGPGEGMQVCGDEGEGRLLEPDDLAARIEAARIRRWMFPPELPVLLTAGPTREPIDPVRYLSNRSSGRMGYALAAAFREAGAAVTLVSGPTALTGPEGVTMVRVETSREMMERVLASAPDCAIFCAVAAVADFRPARASLHKRSKDATPQPLPLELTDDILMAVSRLSPRPFLVGFAAETHDLEVHARAKLERKALDVVVANPVGPGLGFESEDNEALVLWPGGSASFGRMPKSDLAPRLVDLIHERFTARAEPRR
jgi:phosphopantothenoylcysteine decarboxylase/phosphopantothenate--cysteine ligase